MRLKDSEFPDPAHTQLWDCVQGLLSTSIVQAHYVSMEGLSMQAARCPTMPVRSRSGLPEC